MECPGLYEVLDWFPSQAERQRLLAMLYLAKPKLFEQGKLKKMEAWQSSQ